MRPDADQGHQVTSVENALHLLREVCERGLLRVSEAADLIGVSRSTAHRLLSALRASRFVEQEKPNGPYTPGIALTRIGMKSLHRIDLARVARAHLVALAQDTGETCHVVQLQGSSVRFVDGVAGSHPQALGSRVGIVLPSAATAGGKAILAALPLDHVRGLFCRGVHALTGRSLKTLEEIEEHLADVARAGFATNVDESMPGMTALGVVVRGRAGEPIGALTLAAPSQRLPPARMPVAARRMQRASLSISETVTLLQGADANEALY